jgi:L-alanine-DL-glutamate epimerase-like enolase superfamily enzyme
MGLVKCAISPVRGTLKSRILGENPHPIDYLFPKIAQFGGNARHAGGVYAVEMALWDIAGTVYNIPVYQMLVESGATRFASTPTPPSRWIRRITAAAPKSAKPWA